MSRNTLLLVPALYPIGLVALTLVHALWPQRGGPIALTEIAAPHLFLLAIVVVPLAFLPAARVLRVALVAALLVAVVRFGDEIVSLPRPTSATGDSVRVLSWNLEAGAVSGAELVSVLGETDAAVVALQELTPEHVKLLQTDARITARFPYRLLLPRPGVLGTGLLSTSPIHEREVRPVPGQLVTLEVGRRAVTVLNAHPLPGAIRTATTLRVPYDFDASQRDADIVALRTWLQPVLDAGGPVLVLGDYNVTDREPAYGDLAHGLHDAYLETGLGSGATWRPERFKDLPFGLLRIDYLLSAGGLVPSSMTTDCTPRGGDHCVIKGSFAFR